MVESWAYHTFDPTLARRERARLTADQALHLQPDLPEGHLALGFSYYYGDRDYERALAEFEIAKRGLPNEAQAYMAIGAIQAFIFALLTVLYFGMASGEGHHEEEHEPATEDVAADAPDRAPQPELVA